MQVGCTGTLVTTILTCSLPCHIRFHLPCYFYTHDTDDYLLDNPKTQNNIDITGVLSSCWKDNQVDAEERGLELMKVLVDNQADIFASLGVQFPTWDNRPLAIIDMVHCLAQYTKYCEIQRDLSRQYVKKCDSVTVSAKQICLIRNHLTVSVLSPSTKKLKVTGTGHPLLASRSYMDVSKACRFCDVQSDEGLFCDACLCFYCGDCEKESCAAPPNHWICRPCRDLDRLEYAD